MNNKEKQQIVTELLTKLSQIALHKLSKHGVKDKIEIISTASKNGDDEGVAKLIINGRTIFKSTAFATNDTLLFDLLTDLIAKGVFSLHIADQTITEYKIKHINLNELFE